MSTSLSGKIFAFNVSRVKSTLTARRFPDDGNRLAGVARSHAAPEARLPEGAAADQTETEQPGSQQHQGYRLRHRNRPGHEQVGQVIGIARIQQTWTNAEHLLPGQQVRGVRVQDIVGIRVPFRVRRDDDFAELTARVVAALDRLDLPCVCRSRDTRGKQAAGNNQSRPFHDRFSGPIVGVLGYTAHVPSLADGCDLLVGGVAPRRRP